jgi:GntP family gluconate:H+ symporter
MRNALSASVRPIADVLLIIAGGGAFQHVLPDAEECNAIMHSSQKFALSPLLLGWIISMLLSVSTGSATVAIADASGLLGLLAGRRSTCRCWPCRSVAAHCFSTMRTTLASGW